MGILARLFGWAWRRWADYQSVVAILDVLDFKTAVGGGIGFVAMTFIGATNMDWSAPAIILAALAAGALVSITMVALRLFFRPDVISPADPVQIEFRWKPAGENDPFEINAIVTARQNIKNLALIGHFATALHTLSNVKWTWEPSIRLLKLDDIFKGEVKAVPVINCPRNAGNSMMIFNERAWATKESQLILLRVTAISDAGEQYLQEAYHARRVGEMNLLDPINLNDIAYVEGAKNPVAARAGPNSLPVGSGAGAGGNHSNQSPYSRDDIDEMLTAMRRISVLLNQTAVDARDSAQELLNQWAHILDKKGKSEFMAAMDHAQERVQAVVTETWEIVKDYRHYHDEIGPILNSANFSGRFFQAIGDFRNAASLLPGESGYGATLNLVMPQRDEFAGAAGDLQRWMTAAFDRLPAAGNPVHRPGLHRRRSADCHCWIAAGARFRAETRARHSTRNWLRPCAVLQDSARHSGLCPTGPCDVLT